MANQWPSLIDSAFIASLICIYVPSFCSIPTFPWVIKMFFPPLGFFFCLFVCFLPAIYVPQGSWRDVPQWLPLAFKMGPHLFHGTNKSCTPAYAFPPSSPVLSLIKVFHSIPPHRDMLNIHSLFKLLWIMLLLFWPSLLAIDPLPSILNPTVYRIINLTQFQSYSSSNH